MACARCDVGRKLKPKTLADFSPAEIQRRKKHGDLRRARCTKCELHQPNKCKAKAGQCRTCRNLVSVSHLRQYNSKANDGICRTCWRKATDLEAATAKVCPQCSTPLKPAATPGSWCQSCAYPPCAGCQKVARPNKGPYHAKHKPVWLCPACTGCPQCNQPLKASSKPGTWCQSCAYPPCAGCQKVARPSKDTYHAKHRPFWRCAECAQESCPMCQANPMGQDAGGGPDAACPQCAERGPKCAVCQQPMLGRPHSHGWCHGCAFPPCAAGCGRPRPSRSGRDKDKYHAKLMPEWTCQTCQLSQSEPAKRRKIHEAAQTDALPPLPPAEPPEQNASPAASFGQPKKRKPLSTPTPAERYSAPAEADRPCSPAAVSFGQPKKRRSSSACPGFSLPAEVPEAMHLEESQPF